MDGEVAALPPSQALGTLRSLFRVAERACGLSEAQIEARLRLIAADGEDVERRLLRWYIALDRLTAEDLGGGARTINAGGSAQG